MKKVLIVSHSFPPMNDPSSQRAYYLAKYLGELGWDSTVLTAKVADSSLGWSDWGDNDVEVRTVRTRSINITRLRAVKTAATNDRKRVGLKALAARAVYKALSAIAIPDKAALWIPFALRTGGALARDQSYSVVLSTSPRFSNHTVARKLAHRGCIPWVADFQDFHFIGAIEDAKLFPLSRHLQSRLEQRVISYADRLIFTTESMRQEYARRYQQCGAKSHVVYNGFEDQSAVFGDIYPPSGPLTVFYAGSFYQGERSPLPLIRAMDVLISEGIIGPEDVRIQIAGAIDEGTITDIRDSAIGGRVELLGTIDRRDAMKRMRQAHLLWLIVADGLNHSAAVPIKLYEYLDARRTILAFVPRDSEAAQIVQRLGVGVVLRQELTLDSTVQNAELLKEYVRQYREGLLQVPLKASPTSLYEYSWRYKAEQVAAVLDEVLTACSADPGSRTRAK